MINRIVFSVIIVVSTGWMCLGLEMPHGADINNDGVVDKSDLRIIRNLMADPEAPYSMWTDVNRDGTIDIRDLVKIRNNLNTQLPAREFFFDLGTDQSPLADGAVKITPGDVYNSEAGYGWIDEGNLGSLWAEDREWADPTERDYIGSTERTRFRVDIPPGIYEIFVTFTHVPGADSMRFGLREGAAPACSYRQGAYGDTHDFIRPTAGTSIRRFMSYAGTDDYIWITLGAGNTSSSNKWGVSTIEIKPKRTELALHNVHISPDRGYNFYVPDRNSNWTFVSNAFGNYQQDWDFVVGWLSDVIHPGMTEREKVLAVGQKIWDHLRNAGTSAVHPVDVIFDAKGVCVNRSELFQFCMHTLGIPSRGTQKWAITGTVFGGHDISLDPLRNSQLHDNVPMAYADGVWFTYDSTHGSVYECTVMDLLADPTIVPIMYQEERVRHPFYWTQIEQLVFLIDMQTGKYSGTARPVIYTPRTAKTLFGDTLDRFPFRLSSRRPGFEPDDHVLPIIRFYGYNVSDLSVNTNDTVRHTIDVSTLEGIDRLRNQINVVWGPSDQVSSDFVVLAGANGNLREYAFSLPPDQEPPIPIIIDIPQADLIEGSNEISVKLLTSGVLRIRRAGWREDSQLVFPVAETASASNPSNFQLLTYHIFWNVDLVYKINARYGSREWEFDFSHMPNLPKSVLMITGDEPTEVLSGAQYFQPDIHEDWDFHRNNLVIRNVPAYLNIKY